MSLLTEFFSDENNRNAMVLSLISGLSTGLGGVFIALFGSPSKRTTGFMLAFASGVMIYVSVFDLLPESYEKIGIQPLIISVCYPFITKSYDLFVSSCLDLALCSFIVFSIAHLEYFI